MKKRKYLGMLLAFCLIVSSLVGCGDNKSNSVSSNGNKELTLLYMFKTNNLNPHVDQTYIPLAAGIVETLVKVDKDLSIKPWLLESWDTKDSINWTFIVKDNVKFQDGTKLDAEMVKRNIEAVNEKNPGIKKLLDIKSMKAEGQVLKITTNKENPSLPSEFVHPNTAIINMDAKNKDSEPIGTGAFKVEKFIPNSSIQLVKNTNYWDGDVKLDKVNFQFNEDANSRIQAIQSGEADAIYRIPAESIDVLNKNTNVTVMSEPSLRCDEVMYNLDNKNLQSAEARKGLDSLIDRKEIVSKIMYDNASVTYGPYIKGVPFGINYTENPYGTKEALEHFKKAGFIVKDGKVYDKEGKTLKFKAVTYSNRPELPKIAQVIQSAANEIGIDIDIEVVEDIDQYLNDNNNWDLAVYSMITNPRGDASYLLNSAFKSNSVSNHGHINNKELDSIINKFNVCSNSQERNELAKDALKIVNDETYNSYILFSNLTAAFDTRVSNLNLSQYEYYVLNKDVDVK